MAIIVVTCESCGSRFRLDSDKLNKPRNKVRCSHCKNVFVVEQPEENDLVHIEISEEEGGFLPESDSEEMEQFVAPEPARERREPSERSTGKRRLLVAGIVAVPLIVIVAAAFLWAGRILKQKKLPVAAAKPEVTISNNVKAFYLENSHSGEVLVIEGKVLNKSSRPVSFVMIEGKLFDRKDNVVLKQSCYAGNPISRKDITRLKLSDIEKMMMNREGQNLKDVRIPPSGEASFLLVFHNLPEISTLSNYSVNVVSSELN